MAAANYEVPDSTDWTDTSIPSFASVDASLRCQVCKDFYDAAVITNCTHTFCSSCIRRAIAADGRCPACRSNASEHSLRRNVAIQEVVDAFQAGRQQALDVARAHKEAGEASEAPKRGAKRKRKGTEEQPTSNGGMRTRSQRKRARQDTDGAADAVMIDDSEDGEDASVYEQSQEELAQPEDGLVSCPMCSRRMKEEEVFGHLDKCDGKPEAAVNCIKARQPPNGRSRTSTPLQPQQPWKPPPERLPQLSYSLLKERDLRDKLKQLGIPSWGSKDLIIRRHKEWVNIVNSNHDSLRPRQKKELLNELDTWERTQGGNAKVGFTSSGDVMKKDFDGAGWMRSNKSDFDDLIANARKGRQKALEKKDEDGSSTVQQRPVDASNNSESNAVSDTRADPTRSKMPQAEALPADTVPHHLENRTAADLTLRNSSSQPPPQSPHPQELHDNLHLPSPQYSQDCQLENTSQDRSEPTSDNHTPISSPIHDFTSPSYNNNIQHANGTGSNDANTNTLSNHAHANVAEPAVHRSPQASSQGVSERTAALQQDEESKTAGNGSNKGALHTSGTVDPRVKRKPMFTAP